MQCSPMLVSTASDNKANESFKPTICVMPSLERVEIILGKYVHICLLHGTIHTYQRFPVSHSHRNILAIPAKSENKQHHSVFLGDLLNTPCLILEPFCRCDSRNFSPCSKNFILITIIRIVQRNPPIRALPISPICAAA